MKKRLFKQLCAVAVSAAMVTSLTACGNSGKQGNTGSDADASTSVPTIDQIKLGEDYTDITADLKFITHKTDLVDNVFQEYIAAFQEMYPNINIEYEGITDYANDITLRLTTGDWGDICMVPVSVDKSELSNYFTSFGTTAQLSSIYESNMLNDYAYQKEVYGVPSMANAQGIVYNKAVFEAAGITELPATPDEFLDDLQKIKDNTDVTAAMYTNFAAGWTMTAWDSYIDGGATGDADFKNDGLTKGENPFSDRGDGTGPYAVYNVLYEAVSRGLTEDDPTTTDWEGCKGMINSGSIGCMALGSWSVVQMQEAGPNGDDIGYMPFPITVNGKRYASAGPDYCYGINCKSSTDNQIAAMCYVKWLVEKSGFAQDQGGISIVTGDAYPDALADFEGIELIVNAPAAEGEENLWNDINNGSELGITVSGAIPKEIVEAAVSGTKTMDEMVADWNERWTAAQESNGVTH
ncbi:MAG: extracellular solute-binding protein [Lachnospiraceae bacterium]|nr:extracellular solute-binding protein [Lachnospiraceae bacterium]